MTQEEKRAAKAATVQNSAGLPVIRPLDPELDLVWAKSAPSDEGYFAYHFSGNDIQVYIEGLDKTDACDLPIMDMAFQIQQQKVPVYGFWSYTFDAMMRGTRIVTGQFRCAAKYANYMTEQIAAAAANRVNVAQRYPIRGLDTDEANIEKYWTRAVDPTTLGTRNLWSSHPPFNFICVYGMESTNIIHNPEGRKAELAALYEKNGALMIDYNERLVEANVTGTGRLCIENVELTSMQCEYTPDGQVVSEVYSFVAHDIITMSIK